MDKWYVYTKMVVTCRCNKYSPYKVLGYRSVIVSIFRGVGLIVQHRMGRKQRDRGPSSARAQCNNRAVEKIPITT